MIFSGPSRTKQAFKDECDINTILGRYKETGRLPDLIKQNPKYGDFTSPLNYQQSLNTVIQAEEQFQLLPAKIRDRFHNDPKTFLEFTSDPKNLPEMVQMGLAVKRQTNQTNDEKLPDQKKPSSKVKKDPSDESQES